MRKAIKNIVGLQVQKLRVGRGISQEDFASACQRKGWNVTREIVARIETGVRCVTDFELLLMSECLEVAVSDLLPTTRQWQNLRRKYLAD